ncbi:MAG: EAL domain-containing protein [Vicinamibacteria bacterium]|nr:EAL domain-containing protein [Vicinamibacteria bacterium]
MTTLLQWLALVGLIAGSAYLWGRRVRRRLEGRISDLKRSILDVSLKMEQNEMRFHGIVEAIGAGVTLHDASGGIVFANPATQELLGVTLDQLIGRQMIELEGDALGDDGQPIDREREPVAAVLATGEPVRDLVMGICRGGSSERIWLVVSAEPRKDQDGRITEVICTFNDITERRRAHERIRHLAYHDALTQLPNRELFLDRLGVALVQARRRGSGVGLLFVDLDGFKVINDSLGHSFGDSVLRIVARRLTQAVRASDTVARFGGDEFTVLLPGVMTGDDVLPVTRRLQEFLRRPIHFEGRELALSASIGVALFPSDAQEIETLLKNADTALYRAKELGRDHTEIYTPALGERVRELLDLDARLRVAVKSGELELHYQPIVSLTDGQLEGFEALLRWHDPRRGLVMPGEFIPSAEAAMGAIHEIGAWVMKTACRQLGKLPVRAGRLPRVAVNLSARQFHAGDIVEFVRSLLKESAIAPESLELEITEGVALHGESATEKILRKLKRLGVRLAIDDFGTGYSSLSYLRRFPIDTLKVDRSFVQDAVSSREAAGVTRAIIGVGRQLGLHVVAEGVETEEHLRLLRLAECDAVQGYLLGRPAPLAELDDLVGKIPERWPKELAIR